jgi:hypothetical protein
MPGLSAVLALPILWLSARLALDRERRQLPGFLRRRALARERFAHFIDKALPMLIRIEAWLRPRPSFLTEPRGRRLVGIALGLFALGLAMPLPLGNSPIATGISIVALGLIEEDGRALSIGLAVGVVACLWLALLATVGIQVVDDLFAYFGLFASSG